MIITKTWLKKYIENIDKFNDKEIYDVLNNSGFEVERFFSFSNQGLISGKIIDVLKIENTHLNFCTINIGNNNIIKVVCGADNVRKDLNVIVAPLGSKLANGLEMELKKIKGYSSEGMICAFNEIGFSNSVLTKRELASIIELPDTFMPGDKNVLNKIGLDDVCFEIDLTLNRSDCLAAYELAREIANGLKLKLKSLELYNINNILQSFSENHQSQLTSCVTEIKNIGWVSCQTDKLNNSTLFYDLIWLKLNNVVIQDNNNFEVLSKIIALETGQPLILLDNDKITNEIKIINDYSENNNKLLALVTNDELICVLGDTIEKKFMPTIHTKNILIISLSVPFTLMRKQQKFLNNQNTIELQRWIKPISDSCAILGVQRILFKLNLLTSLKIYKMNINNLKSDTSIELKVSMSYVNKLIGFNFTFEDFQKLLSPLKFLVYKNSLNQNEILIKTNPYRTDLKLPADIAEEMGRLYGYNNLLSQPLTLNFFNNEFEADNLSKNIFKLKQMLIFNNYQEVKTYSLISEKEALEFNYFNYKNLYNLLMPLSKDKSTMRSSVLPSIIDVLSYNNSRGLNNCTIFEISKISFFNEKNDFLDNYHLCFASQTILSETKWLHKTNENSFYYIKGFAIEILKKLSFDISDLEFRNFNPSNNLFHPFQTAQLYLKNNLVGIIGQIHPEYIKNKDLKNKTYFCELNLTKIFNLQSKQNLISNHLILNNPISRDITIIYDPFKYNQILNILKNDINNLQSINLIDYFVLDKNNLDKVAMTFSMVFNNKSKQLTNDDVNIEMLKIENNLKSNNINVR